MLRYTLRNFKEKKLTIWAKFMTPYTVYSGLVIYIQIHMKHECKGTNDFAQYT